MKANEWHDTALRRFNQFATATKRLVRLEPDELSPEEVHLLDLGTFAANQAGRESFLEEIDNRIMAAKEFQRGSIHSHPDLCFYQGMEQTLMVLKKDFLSWMEK